MRPRSLVLVLAAVLVTTGSSGCDDGVSRADCLPALPTAQPAAVAVGAQLTIASTGSACAARYDDGKEYSLELLSLGRTGSIDLGDVDVEPDGSFSVTLAVPSDASPGESAVSVHGSPYDDPCDDTASCASYGVSVVVLPAP